MYKIGFLIFDYRTTGYYKSLFDKLVRETGFEIYWVNIELENIIYTRKSGFLKKLDSFLSSKILYAVSYFEKRRSVFKSNNRFLEGVLIPYHDILLNLKSTLRMPQNRISLSIIDAVNFQASNFDLVVRAGFGILDDTFFNCSKKGIISLHLGDNRKVRGSMPGFYEAFYGHEEVGFIIQKITTDLDGGEILFRANYPAKSRWCDNHLFLVGMSFDAYFNTILNVVYNNLSYSEERLPYFNKLFLAPNLFISLHYFFLVLVNFFKNKLTSIFGHHPTWHVLFAKGNWDSVKFYSSRVVKNNPRSFFADPFPIDYMGEQFLFVEEFLFDKNKGVISVLQKQGHDYNYLGIVLDLSFHLSFPFLYRDDSGIYMIPEQSQSGYIGLYRAVEFPLKWDLERRLIDNVDAADSFVFKFNNKFWLFSNFDSMRKGVHLSELHIFYADDLCSEWIAHPQNENQRILPFGKRNAGAVFNQGGKLYRFGQIQGNSFYGKGLALFEITISETSYTENYVRDFYPDFKRGLKGMHHISTNDDFTFIDCYY